MLDFQVYLLAAGEGRRAGGPKAWQPLEGRTLLEKQVDFLLGRFRASDVAVSIQAAWRGRCRKIHPDVRWVPEDPAAPPMAALQALLKAAPLRRWAFFYHVDMPVWEPALFEALAEAVPALAAAALEGAPEAVAPAYAGRKGHPVLLSPELEPALLALDPASDRLDLWLRTRREATVPVPFACIHENWNERRQVG